MKTTIKTILILFSLAILAACEKDGDLIYLRGQQESDLLATESNVVLSQEESEKIVLSLTWTKSTLSVSNPGMDAPNIESIYIQASTTEDFSFNIVESLESGLSRAYTGAELNAVAKNLNMTAEVATPVYFRIRSSVGSNVESLYSSAVTVNITSFEIDMTVAFILDEKLGSTSWTLYSPNADGIYTGFVGSVSWFNFYVREGDGLIWGNLGVEGNAFLLSTEDSKYNCWFPSFGGCYYVDFNTVKGEWSSLYIPVLKVSGDLAGDMTFDRPNTKWYLPFTASAAGTYTIQLQADGKTNNYSTGDSEGGAINTPVTFAQENGNIVMAQQAGEITLTVAQAGDYTLTVDLSNPKGWTCEAVSGSLEPDPVNPVVYLPGIDDGITGPGWTFDNTLPLYNEAELAYAGVVNVNSLSGYTISIEQDNWNDKYVLGEGDAYSGTLLWQGQNNLPAPTAGVYLIDVNLIALTYQLTSVGDRIFVSGLNDEWDFETVLNATTTPGVYSGQITINQASLHGFEIHIDDSWNHKFGGSDGKLYYSGSGIKDDANLAPGTYTLTVNLIEATYVIE